MATQALATARARPRFHPRNAWLYLGVALFTVAVLFPFYWMVMSAFSPKYEIFHIPPRLVPGSLTLENFLELPNQVPLLLYIRNSLVVASASAFFSVAFSFLAAYAFARIEFPGRDLLFFLFLMTTALPAISTVLPLFVLFRNLKLTNTLQGLVILLSSLVVPFSVWVLVSFIKQVPVEIEEAATIDGASLFDVIFRVVMPTTLPALATLIIINWITSWNDLLFPLVFAVTRDTKMLSVSVVQLTTQTMAVSYPWELMSAIGTLMTAPVVLLVAVFQRGIISGLTRGAVK